jgi:hypothetical protein
MPSGCCGLCVNPKFMYWKLYAQSKVLGGETCKRSLGHEGPALTNGLAFIIISEVGLLS